MPLTDDQGNPVEADDPAIPSVEKVLEVRAAADGTAAALGLQKASIVDLEAQIHALVSLIVPPQDEDPMRRVFEHRRHLRRLEILEGAYEAATKKRIVVPGG